MLNLGSLVLGLIAWTLAVIILIQHKQASHRRFAVFCIESVSACAISLCLQIFEINRRVNIQDWSALLDTSHAVALAAAWLLVGTIILNLTVLIVRYGKQR